MFCDSFSDAYKNNFTYEGKRALFDYLESLSEATGEDVELDIIALCIDFTEYEDFAQFSTQYTSCTTFEDIKDHTQVIEIEGSDRFIIQDF